MMNSIELPPQLTTSTSVSASASNPYIQGILFLGTGSAIPSPSRRNTSGLIIKLSSGSLMLIDCGEGTQHQIMQAHSIRMSRIDAILITHLHGDHCFGIFGLLCSIAANGRTEPLIIVGSAKLKHMVETVLAIQGGWDAFQLQFIIITENESHDCGYICGMHIHADALSHTIPAFAYTITEPSKPGSLHIDAAQAQMLGVKGKRLALLKAGQDVLSDDGVTTIKSSDYLGPSIPGLKVSIVQDCSDCTRAYPSLQECDLLIHEATYDQSLAEKAKDHGHSTAAMAARVAFHTRASMLILTHFSSRYGIGMKNRISLQQNTDPNANGSLSVQSSAASASTASLNHSEDVNDDCKNEQKNNSSDMDSDGVSSMTNDDLVNEAIEAYSTAAKEASQSEASSPTTASSSASCIPIFAAEDFLLFERQKNSFVLKSYAKRT